jgi:hypothetical protein
VPDRIDLGPLPAQGVLVQRNGGVVFVSLSGEVLARVPDATLVSATQAPGRTFLDIEGTGYMLDPATGSLVRQPTDSLPPVRDDRRVPLPRPVAPDGRPMVGHWRFARLAPDGNLIVAQWSAECEFPVAYLMTLQDGDPVAVTGSTELRESFVLGVTRSSQAVVVLPSGACGTAVERPGVYTFATHGDGRFITWVPSDPPSLARMWGDVGQPLPT